MATIRRRNGKYQVMIRRQGAVPLSKTFHNRKDALAWARNKEVEFDRGEYQSLERLDHQLELLLRRYLSEVTPHKKSAEVETYRLKRLLRDPIVKIPIRQLSEGHLASFRDRRIQDGVRACHHDLVTLRHLFEIAKRDWGYPISGNPASRISWPPSPRPRERRLKPTEYEALKTAAAKTRSPYLWPAVEFALATAMRRGEILALRWEDVDVENRLAHLLETKNGYPRDVPLSNAAIGVLNELSQLDGDRCFNTSPEALRQAWERLVKRARVTDLRFHDLRHEAITRLFEAGLSAPEVALISGHRDIRQLHRYTHLRPEHVVKRLDVQLGRLGAE